ncbi:MAG: peptide chain release factor 1 [Firmicutes bacterium]|nr:peptide chain release factor 1 [Bacillota bacterium]MCL2771389.1 peptide chain release factor 1 [Bacillota bacterium]
MLEKIEKIKNRYDELTKMVSDPAVIADSKNWQKLVKEHNSIEEIANIYVAAKKMMDENKDCEELMKIEKDAEMKAVLNETFYENKTKLEALEEELKILLLPKDENDERNVIVEIRGGAGGEEAALFAANLFRMYKMYAESKRWGIEVYDTNETGIGGIKEISFVIKGQNAFKRLKFESGVHRVQRVPETESQGRVHTSTVTVAVLPEAEDVEVEIDAKDLKIDTFCSGGAGGQHVNKTESACRITHLPTGIIVTCQDERSLIKNRDKAMKVLYSRILDHKQQEEDAKYAANRKNQVGTGDRSEKIRTYNYPENRVTDHRIGLTMYSLHYFMNGEMDKMLDALFQENQRKLLEQSTQ